MLSGVADWLVREGWRVVLPSRRYAPIPVGDEDRDPDGRAVWVQARWERPEQLALDARRALGGPADLLVTWVHPGFRARVLESVMPLLDEGAPVVEVRGESVAPDDPRDAVLAGHPVQRVVLGYVRHRGIMRWLSHAEIADGVLTAVRRALTDRPMAEHYVGEVLGRQRH